jgi:hypothetical protein
LETRLDEFCKCLAGGEQSTLVHLFTDGIMNKFLCDQGKNTTRRLPFTQIKERIQRTPDLFRYVTEEVLPNAIVESKCHGMSLSSSENIRAMQEKGISFGVLHEVEVDGRFYIEFAAPVYRTLVQLMSTPTVEVKMINWNLCDLVLSSLTNMDADILGNVSSHTNSSGRLSEYAYEVYIIFFISSSLLHFFLQFAIFPAIQRGSAALHRHAIPEGSLKKLSKNTEVKSRPDIIITNAGALDIVEHLIVKNVASEQAAIKEHVVRVARDYQLFLDANRCV